MSEGRAQTQRPRDLRRALEYMGDGVLMLDPALSIILWNERLRSLLELPPDVPSAGMSGIDLLRLLVERGDFGPGDREAIFDEWSQRIRGGTSFEHERTTPIGRIVEAVAERLPDGGLLVTYRDVTATRTLERRLREQEARTHTTLEAILDNIAQAISLYDPDLRLVAFNRRWTDLFEVPHRLRRVGTPFEEILRHFAQRGDLPASKTEDILRQIRQARRRGAPQTVQRRLADGTVISVDFRMLEDGRLLFGCTDITALKRVELDLREAKERAEAANLAKSVFLANMSHELRTPLNAILGFAEIIRDQLFGAGAVDKYSLYARDVHESGSHLLAILDDVLDLTRIESGRAELRESRFAVPTLVTEAALMLSSEAERSGIGIVVEDSGPLPPLHADRRLIKQILLNLLSNAVKYSSRGGRISVAAMVEATGDLAVCVADTGMGIPREQLLKIFEPFHMASPEVARARPGFGLGLWISRRLAEQHGGALELASTEGEGTLATLRLPGWRLAPEGADAGDQAGASATAS